MRSFLFTAVSYFLLAATASDSSAAIVNADFELAEPSGDRFPPAVGWNGDARLALHTEFGPGDDGTLGNTFVFNQGNREPASQIQSDTFTAGFVYTFEGYGTHNGASADIVFEIGYDNGSSFQSLAAETYDQNLLFDRWEKHPGVSYAPRPGNAEIGNNVVLRFRSTASNGVWLDNVALTIEDAPLFGDVNGDEVVDLSDYQLIRDNFRLTEAVRGQGDLTGPTGASDGVVDFYDFVEWQQNFPLPALSSSGASAAPELTSFHLCILGLTSLATASRRR